MATQRVRSPSVDRHVLRRLREERGLSRDRLAVLAGIASRTLAHLELTDGRRPHRSTVDALARVLGVETEALTHDDPASAGEAVKDRREIADAPSG